MEQRVATAQDSSGVGEHDGSTEKCCRYCFEGSEAGELIAPCACSGGQKWVHLSCLRRWQRGVLVSQPTHPDFYDDDVRHRICNVCKSEYTCKPPTRLELMSSFTGEELAELVEENCLIVAYKDFSAEMKQNVSYIPEHLHEWVIDRHWIDGVFLILQVVEDGKSAIELGLSCEEDKVSFMDQLSSDFTWRMQGRRFQLLFEGPLASVASCDADAKLAKVRELQPPCQLKIKPADGADIGEDGITAVSLTHPIADMSVDAHMSKRYRYDNALVAALKGEQPLFEVQHYIGGPCRRKKVNFVIVISEPGSFEVFTCVHEACAAAQRLAASVTTDEAGAEPSSPKRPRLACGETSRTESASSASGGTALAAALSQSQPEGSAKAEPSPSGKVRVHVFWGAAGWSRCQLMGEIASGSWGLTKAHATEITSIKPEDLYDRVYPRVVFAPKTEMSEKYDQPIPPEQHHARAARLERRYRARQQQLFTLRMVSIHASGDEMQATDEASGGTADNSQQILTARVLSDSSDDDSWDISGDDDSGEEGEEEEVDEGDEEASAMSAQSGGEEGQGGGDSAAQEDQPT